MITWVDGCDYNHSIGLSNELKDGRIIVLPRHYAKTFLSDATFKIWYGSRVSAKTWVKAVEFIYKCATQKYFRGLFARQTQKDARESQFQLFNDLITKIYPWLADEFVIHKSTMLITHKNGNFMRGASFEDPIRSLAEYTDFWIDEPITRQGSVKKTDLLDLKGTLRNSYGIKSQIHLTFNPVSKQTWIYKDFFEDVKFGDVDTLQCNYQHNSFCPPEKVTELEEYKYIDPDRYMVDSLGHWGEVRNDDPFFNHANRIVFKPVVMQDIEDLWASFDFNFDPTTVIFAQRIHGYGIVVLDTIQKKGGTENICHDTKHIVFSHAGRKMVTGDFSGNQRSSVGGVKAGQEITDYLHIMTVWGLQDSNLVNTKTVNPMFHISRDLCNQVMYKVPIYFNDTPGNRALYDELYKAMMTKADNGRIGLFKNREMGYGMDAVDAWRYMLNAMFPDLNRDVDRFVMGM